MNPTVRTLLLEASFPQMPEISVSESDAKALRAWNDAVNLHLGAVDAAIAILTQEKRAAAEAGAIAYADMIQAVADKPGVDRRAVDRLFRMMQDVFGSPVRQFRLAAARAVPEAT